MLTRMWRNRNSPSLLVGMQNGTATLEDSLAVSYKTELTLTTQCGNYLPWYLLRGVENFCLHKNLHPRVCSSFIHTCQNLAVHLRCTWVGSWIHELWYIRTMGYYSALKRKELSSHEKTWRKLKCILLSERSRSEKATSIMIPTIQHSGQLWDQNISGCWCYGEKSRQNTKDF